MAYNKRILFSPPGHRVEYLVVGGGGGAGSDMGGGGGAGGFQSTQTGSLGLNNSNVYFNNSNPSTASFDFGVEYVIEVGAGGAGSAAGNVVPRGDNGGESYISASSTNYPFRVVSAGGGAGGSDYGTGNNANFNPADGASGGGATGYNTTAQGIDGQGFQGGGYAGSYYPGSGGGAGGPGRTAPGDGGIGRRWDILDQEYWWCGGGAGAGYSARAGNGGKGGGGGGAPRVSGGGNGDTSGLAWNNGANASNGSLNSQTNVPGGNGGANTGGGGGGGSHYSSNNKGGNGGSGMVVIQMPAHLYSGNVTGSPLIRSGSIRGDGTLDTIALIYTQSGTYTAITGSSS